MRSNFYSINSEPDYSFKSRKGKGYKSGPIYALFIYALSKTNLPVREEINGQRALALWELNPIGVYKKDGWLYTIKWKPFKKWVERNISRILKTAKEVKQDIRERNEEYEDNRKDKR